MAQKLTEKGRKTAGKILKIQSLVATVISLIYTIVDFKMGYSAVIGGLICIIPNQVFVIYAYRFGGARAAKKITSSFYRGETLKIMLTALMFAVTFIYIPILIGPLMTSYVLCLMVFWVAPLFV